MREALRFIFAGRRLFTFILIGGLVGISTDMMFSYYQPYFIEHHMSSSGLGIFFSIISAASALGAFLMKKIPDYFSGPIIFSLSFAGIGASALSLMLPQPFLFIGPLLMGVSGGFIMPNIRLFVNRLAKDHMRAATVSFATAIYSLGSLCGFFITYAVSDTWPAKHILVSVFLLASMGFLINLSQEERGA
jgi:MFS family permease